jgi:hypothetical protein
MNLNLIFFIIFALTSFLFAIHSFFILYHLIRFGVGTRPKQAAFIFFGGSLFLFILFSIASYALDPEEILKKNTPGYKEPLINQER